MQQSNRDRLAEIFTLLNEKSPRIRKVILMYTAVQFLHNFVSLHELFRQTYKVIPYEYWS